MSTSEIRDKLNMGYETGLKYLNQLIKNRRIKVREYATEKFGINDRFKSFTIL